MDDFGLKALEQQHRFFRFLPNRLGFLARYVEPVPASSTIEEIQGLFNQDPDLDAIPLEEDGGVVGLLARDSMMHGDVRGGLFRSPKLHDFMEPDAPIRDAMESLYQTLKEYEEKKFSKVFLVYHGGRYIGICGIHSVLMHSAKLQAQDLEQAKSVQEALMHIDTPPAHYTLEWFNKMAHEVGGDFLQFRKMNDELWFLGVFDIAGKGVSAALSTSLISSCFATLDLTGALARIKPAQVVSILHKLLRSTISDIGFLACAFLFVDVRTQTLSVYNCGLGPVHAFAPGQDGKARCLTLEPNLPPLGFDGFPLEKMQSTNFRLGPNIRIFVSTDGLTDMKGPSGEGFSDDRVKEFLVERGNQSAAEIKAGFSEFITHFMGLAPQADDITFAILECGPDVPRPEASQG